MEKRGNRIPDWGWDSVVVFLDDDEEEEKEEDDEADKDDKECLGLLE